MKRLVAAALGICIASAVFAQSNFTIVRPADGSKVREGVRVMIPKNSLDEAGSYIGVFLDNKFLEAVVPPVSGSYRVYTLDTKKRQIEDGQHKLELVKYVTYEDQPRIVDRTSVTVTVGNHANVAIPAGGVKLRYNFSPGRQYIYKLFDSVSVSTITGQDNSLGGRPAELPASDLFYRLLYAVDNRYGDGDALLRIQQLPEKGKSYATLLLAGTTEPSRVDEMEMSPAYMRVTSTGRPEFGALPQYFGFTNSGNGGSFENVFSIWPLPVLPEKAVKVGSVWSASYVMPASPDTENLWETNRLTRSFPARGEFVSAEWEMGHPCAKIRNSIAQGTRSLQGIQLEKAGRAFADDKVSMEETIWFALDTKVIVKRVRSIQIDQKVNVGEGTGMGVGEQPGPQPGSANQGPRGAGPKGKLAPPGGGGRERIFQQGVGVQTQSTSGKPTGNSGGFGAGQRSGGGAAPRTQYIRQRHQQTFILEQ